MKLEKKISIITGSASGFGRGIAEKFSKEGSKLVINDINESAGKKVADSINSKGGNAIFVKADISTNTGWQNLVSKTLSEFDKIDIVVNNAGFTHKNQPLLDVSEDDFNKIYNVNVKSLFWSAKHVVPVFQKLGKGNFITVASTAGIRPRPGLTWYNGSKASAILTSKSMAIELAPKKIRVNVVNPVLGVTGMLEDFMGIPDTEENRKKFLATIPLGRLSEPKDVAAATLYFASDDAEFITGACIEVDGGRTI